MRNILFATTFLLSATQLSAQAGTTTPLQATSPTQDETKTEIRAMSGKLKDTLGLVSQQLMSVEKRISVATPEASEGLQQTRGELVTAKTELEASLTAVNSSSPEEWKGTKAKAEALNERVLAMLSGLK